MDTITSIPLARTADLVIEGIDDELLVYDLRSNRAHCLSATAASVWQVCDGKNTTGAIVADLGLDADAVGRALEELSSCDLIQDGAYIRKARSGRLRRWSRNDTVGQKASTGLTRRETTIKMAQYGAAAVTIPLIWSIAGPIPEAAATPTPAQCLQYTDKSCDACSVIVGCCCCCQANGNCKTCYPVGLCSSFTCPNGTKGNCSTTCLRPGPNCFPPGTAFNCKSNGLPGPPSGGAPCCNPLA